MIRAWRSYGEFEGRASVRTWLYRIATQRLPARAGEQQPPAIAVWPGRPGGVPGGFAGRGAAGGSVAAALSRRFAERRVRRSSRDRRVAAEHAAGPDRRLAVPARPPARRADPARR